MASSYRSSENKHNLSGYPSSQIAQIREIVQKIHEIASRARTIANFLPVATRRAADLCTSDNELSGQSIDDVVYEDLTTEVHFITVDNVCNELMDTIYHLLHDHWKFPKQYAKERTLETVILVGEVGVVVFAFGDQPGDNFQVHSLCTLRNDFIRLLADRGTPRDAPVASTSAAAE